MNNLFCFCEIKRFMWESKEFPVGVFYYQVIDKILLSLRGKI